MPALQPRDLLAQCTTEVDCRVVEGQAGSGRPQLDLVASAAAAMAMVATDRHVDREAALTTRGGSVQRTRPVPLIAPSPESFKAEQVEHLLHSDLLAKPVEVNPWHVFLLYRSWEQEEGPFRSQSI
jgi:hypothetical protein